MGTGLPPIGSIQYALRNMPHIAYKGLSQVLLPGQGLHWLNWASYDVSRLESSNPPTLSAPAAPWVDLALVEPSCGRIGGLDWLTERSHGSQQVPSLTRGVD